jgi:predicted N-acetyltransferase YhbS
MNITIRDLTEADDEQANDLLKLAFNNSTNRLNDLRLYRRLQPDGWFAACLEGRMIGTVGAVSYGSVAHVGFMTVHPSLQGQGIGRMLMEHMLNWLERKQVPLITLDASNKGFPLYEMLGFVTLDETLTFEKQIISGRELLSPDVEPITQKDLDELVELDAPIFGANRRKVFESLMELYPSRAFLHRDENGQITGYVFAQMNRIGPWVTFTPGQEEALLKAALTLAYENPVTVCVPAVNLDAAGLLQRYGFEQIRSGRHMVKGKGVVPGDRTKIYAQTSMGAG